MYIIPKCNDIVVCMNTLVYTRTLNSSVHCTLVLSEDTEMHCA